MNSCSKYCQKNRPSKRVSQEFERLAPTFTFPPWSARARLQDALKRFVLCDIKNPSSAKKQATTHGCLLVRIRYNCNKHVEENNNT
mmetsp:Transcript_28543/g.59615  ORF Transcript_28543/g.59615 Transcript_28543/m.59615 type:complete len:86 (-) Transcript_28543:193-450(-)